MSKDTQPTPSETEILRGGKEQQVTLLAQGGETPATVFVRQIAWWEIEHLVNAVGDMLKELTLYTGKPADWVKGLTEESAFAVLEEGRRLNFTSLKRFHQAQKPLKELLAGGNEEREKLMAEVVARVLEGRDAKAASPSSTPSSSPQATVPTTSTATPSPSSGSSPS